MSNWLSDAFDNLKIVSDITYELASLASAFYRTGNEQTSEELWKYVERLRTAEKNVRDAVGESVNESYKASQEATGNMLRACIAVGNVRIRANKRTLGTASKGEVKV